MKKKKYLLLIVILAIVVPAAALYLIRFVSKKAPLSGKAFYSGQAMLAGKAEEKASLEEAFKLLTIRKDPEALKIFDKILSLEPTNITALWGRAEVLRRARDYQQAQSLLHKILDKNPRYAPGLISLAYIKYKDDNLNEALKLVNSALGNGCASKEDEALAFMMLGTINSRRSSKGVFFGKILYGTKIKGNFLKAKELAPGLPEVHLGLGTFYLLAPSVFGGSLNLAIEELELAVRIAPDFATANARLAQAYKKKGNLQKYNLYIRRTKELDPQNEVLKELD